MKPRKSKRLSKQQLRKLRKRAESFGIYAIDIANTHGCYPSAVTNFYNGSSVSSPMLKTILEMIEEAAKQAPPREIREDLPEWLQ